MLTNPKNVELRQGFVGGFDIMIARTNRGQRERCDQDNEAGDRCVARWMFAVITYEGFHRVEGRLIKFVRMAKLCGPCHADTIEVYGD